MPYDLTSAIARNKLAYTLLRLRIFPDAIFNFEQSLQNLEDELIDTENAKRCKTSSCLGLVDALLKNNHNIINNNALADRIKKLFKTALNWFDQLDNPTDDDITAKINTHLQLALIYFGEVLLDDVLKPTYFNPMKALTHLSRISVCLNDFSENKDINHSNFLYYLADLNYRILDFVVSKYHKESDSEHQEEASHDIARASDIGLLRGLDLLKQINISAQGDHWWRLMLNYYVLAIDISIMQGSTLKENYLKLFLDNFIQIKVMTLDDVTFLNRVITDNIDTNSEEDNDSDNSSDYNSAEENSAEDNNTEDNDADNTLDAHGVDDNHSAESFLDVPKTLTNINAEIIRIKKMVELLNTQTETQVIQLIYEFILAGFTTIHTRFRHLCDDNSYALKMADFDKECFSARETDPNQAFPVELIQALKIAAQNQSNDALQNKAIEVHKLCVTVVLALYQRADFPNKQLQFHLRDQNNLSLFNFGPVDINPTELKDVDNSDNGIIVEPDVDVTLPVCLTPDSEQTEVQQQSKENRKRKPGASVGENPFLLMPPASRSAQEIEMKKSKNDPTAKENPHSPGNR